MTQRTKHTKRENEESPVPAERLAGAGILYVVATPIGNLDDLSRRARDVLGTVEVIAAEDTRHTRHLLVHCAINTRLLALHEHNETGASAKFLEMLAAGKSIALVSDAGTPCISDPGAHLVGAARAAGFRVVPVPGANAAVTALSASGFEGPFLFYGFLPAKAGERRHAIEKLAHLMHTLVFYEAPHRVSEAVADLAAVLGGARRLVIARELTKKFEAIHECELGVAQAWLEADADNRRGEFVLLVAGAPEDRDASLANAEATLALLLAELPLKQAVKLAAAISGAPRNSLYTRALEISANKPTADDGT
jgi:16S rRNA (cytidine1402-2'-O)-methyltransferase